MISQQVAIGFANDWIESWNAHDLERILAHYSADFEMSSPVNVFAGASSVTIIYRGHRGLSAEVFWFNAEHEVYRAAAHYGE